MSASMVGLAFVVLVLLGSPAHSTTIAESCPDGEALESLDIWHGYWVDQLGFNCTDGSEPDLIPPGATGGGVTSGVCEGSGGAAGGVESIEWYSAIAEDDFLGGNSPVVYLNVTCLNGDIFAFADDVSLDDWNLGEPVVQSCDEGEYVAGLSAEVEDSDSDNTDTESEVSDGGIEIDDYVIVRIDLVCSSSGITPAPTLAETTAPTTAPVTVDEDAGTDTPVGAIVGGVIGGALVLGGLILLALCKTGRIRTGKQRGGSQYPVARQYPQPIEQ